MRRLFKGAGRNNKEGSRDRSLQDPFIGFMLHVDSWTEDRKKLIVEKGQAYLDGNAMKWNQLLRSGATNYDQYDTLGPGSPYPTVEAMLQFCEANKLVTMFHTLLWAKPEFFPVNKNYPITDKAARTTANNNHISTIFGHFTGRFQYAQLWNELYLPNGDIKTYPGVPDIDNAEILSNLQALRAADQTVKVGFNDFAIETNQTKLQSYLDLIDYLRSQGEEVDFLGFQCHLKMTDDYSEEVFYSRFKSVIDKGVEVHITELDLEVAQYVGTDVQRRNRQNDVLRMVTNAAVRAGVKGIWWWGLDDDYSWLYAKNGTPYPSEAPLPFSPSLERKAIWDTLVANLTGSNRKL